MLNLDSSPSTIFEYERQMRINEDIIRFLTVKIKYIDEKPSPLMVNKTDKNKVLTTIEDEDTTTEKPQ